MKVLIASCGRTGTNINVEALMGSDLLKSVQREERSLFIRPRQLNDGYLEKTDTVYIPSLESIDEVMRINPDLKIVWTVRDFRDTILSKMYRGRAGGDSHTQAEDATPEGCKADILWMKECFDYIRENYPNNVVVSKMENLLTDTKNHMEMLCSFLNIPYQDSMLNFAERTKLETKRSRYQNKIDLNQVALWQRIEVVYDGYFKDKDMSDLMYFGESMNLHWGYTSV